LHSTQRWGTPRFGSVGKSRVQRSFVGSLRLCRRLRCLRMTAWMGSWRHGSSGALPTEPFRIASREVKVPTLTSKYATLEWGTLLFFLFTGDHVEHKVPPLRFASVGMPGLFRYVGTAEFFPLAGSRFGSVASHLCTERKDGAPFGLVRVRGSIPVQNGWFAARSRFLTSFGTTMFKGIEHGVAHSFVSSSYLGWGDVVFDYSVEVDLASL
jgi:hypothetical protein